VRALRFLLVILVLFSALILLHGVWMPPLGEYLVQSQQPSHADAVVVLAGDYYGNRILKGAELVKQGYAPKAYISGPGPFYGLYEGNLAIQFAATKGYPESLFESMPNNADSTLEEAQVLWPELQKRNVHSLLVVTSDYHTRRSFGVWRRVAKGADVHIIAAPDWHYQPATWWKTRPSRKIFLLEWMKTLADRFGI